MRAAVREGAAQCRRRSPCSRAPSAWPAEGAQAVAASGRAGAATKVSRRDLGWAVQRTRADPAACGATTVAATAWAARRAGVHVFATGGLGGVHRGASDTRDAVWQSTGE